ncbi:MAG: hypothetical protein IKN17_03335 [Ruminococcus sp.]|nr:hypothetical protein [Ruminococcus sp.]
MNILFKSLLTAAAAAGMALAGMALPADSPLTQSTQTVYAADGSGKLASCTVSMSQSTFNYTGSAITPDSYNGKDLITVTDGGVKLVKGVDYTVSYQNNMKPGAATAVITGTGKYSGGISKTFMIRPKKNSITALHTGNGAIRVEWNEDPDALAYQVLYSQDSSFSTYHSTTIKSTSRTYVNLTNVPKAGETWYVKVRSFVTRDGDVSSTRYGYYSAVKSITAALDINKVSIPYISYTYTGGQRKPSVKAYDVKGSLIPAQYYSVTYANNINVGEARIVVTCKGPYRGSYIKTFYVKPEQNEITSLTGENGAFRLSWKRATAGAVGYQVLYSTTSDFSDNVHSYTSTDLNDLTERFSKVPAVGETWYVKVRSFITKDGTVNSTRYGNYSAVKSVYTKVADYKTTTANAQLYANAAFSPTSLGTVAAGSKAEILTQSGRWYKVSVNGSVGWLYNKAFGVTANVTGRLTASTVGIRADDIIFDIGTTPSAIMNYSITKVYYRASAAPTGTRDDTAAEALTTMFGACYQHAAVCDLLLEHAGYQHIIIEGRSTSGEHNWNAYKTPNGWRYLDSTSFVVYPQGFADFTSKQVKTIRSFVWDMSKYEAD